MPLGSGAHPVDGEGTELVIRGTQQTDQTLQRDTVLALDSEESPGGFQQPPVVPLLVEMRKLILALLEGGMGASRLGCRLPGEHLVGGDALLFFALVLPQRIE